MTLETQKPLEMYNEHPTVRKIVYAEYDKARQKGHTEEVAWEKAFRQVPIAGWYKTTKGWDQLGPDLRDKVNLREAIPQPNGKYLVRDVEVFYPNQTKAIKKSKDFKVFTYTPEMCRGAIEYTNAIIAAGGQKPAITTQHPGGLAREMGVVSHCLGNAINFRESIKGAGWVTCDFVDVDPSVIADWRNGKYTGLSAGFAYDAGMANLRFGHIALLGGEMQALAFLPVTQVFSSDVVCFSVSADSFSFKEQGMNAAISPDIISQGKKAFAQMVQAFENLEKNPGDVTSFAAAQEEYNAFCDKYNISDFAAEADDKDKMDNKNATDLINKLMESDEEEHATDNEDDDADETEDEDDDASDEFADNPSEETIVPEEPKLKDKDITSGKNDSTVFSAKILSLESENKRLGTQVRELTRLVQGFRGQSIKREFSSYLDGLQKQGHMFDFSAAMSSLIANVRQPEQLLNIKKLLESTPKKTTLADAGQHFSFDDALSPKKGASKDEQTLMRLKQSLPGMTFSADDVKLGEVFS